MPVKGLLMPPRVDTLVPGTLVVLRIGRVETEGATFVRITGEGEARLATFATVIDGEILLWESHRHSQRWTYGETHRIVQVVHALVPDDSE